MVNWGNSDFEQSATSIVVNSTGPTLGNYASVTPLRGPFRVNNTSNAITPFQIRDILDGTSNTMMMSEVLIGPNTGTKSDSRGDYWAGNEKNAFMYTASTPPNTAIIDQMDSTNGCPNPAVNPPCFGATGTQLQFNAARSYHNGGVNVLFCDGSVKFIKNSVSFPTFRAISTMSGGEVISGDAY